MAVCDYPIIRRRLNHRLHLFDSAETLGKTVASFLLDGYHAGDHLLIVAKPRHRDAVFAALRRAGCFPADTDVPQCLVALDAADVLRQITRNGAIDAALFRKTVSPLVETLARTGRLRIYGEVVELLAEEEDIAGALALEQLWNDLATEVPFTLMCGYSSNHFLGNVGRRALKHVCQAHTRSLATEEDRVGSYLLALA